MTQSASVRLRSVEPNDLDIAEEIRAMHVACFPFEYSKGLTDYGFWWIGYDKDEPACFAGLWKSSNFEQAGYLCRAGVLPAYRGMGLQRRLVRVREKKARALGWRLLVSDTNDNPPSANNLIGCGYRTFTPPTRWAMPSAVYWKKEIQ
jgi:GNAT superfamily N-acetyltransferase